WQSQWTYVYWQRSCLTYSRQPTETAYEEDPVAVAVLRAADSRYLAPAHPLFDFADGKPPTGWTPPALYVPMAWEKIGSVYPSKDIGAIAFLHGRKCQSAERLVVAMANCCALGGQGQ